MNIKLVESHLTIRTIQIVKLTQCCCIFYRQTLIAQIINLWHCCTLLWRDQAWVRIGNKHDFLNNLLTDMGMMAVRCHNGLDSELVSHCVQLSIDAVNIVWHNLNIKIIPSDITQGSKVLLGLSKLTNFNGAIDQSTHAR